LPYSAVSNISRGRHRTRIRTMDAAVQRDPADPTTSPLESEISFYANPHPRSHEGRYKEMEGEAPTVWSQISVHGE